MGSLSKTLLCSTIVLLCWCTSLIQANVKETEEINKVHRFLRQADGNSDDFLQNCPAGEILLEILEAAPSVECRTALITLVGIDPSDYIARAQEVLGQLSIICQEDCRNFVYSALLRCSRSSIPLLQLACSSNHNQSQCWQAVALNDGTAVLGTCYPDLYPAEVGSGSGATMTGTFPPTLDENGMRVCTSYCQDALSMLRKQHGCCVSNAFNTSTFGLLQLGIANYSLWSSCEVETTSICTTDLNFVNIFEEFVSTTDSKAVSVAITLSLFVLAIMVAVIVPGALLP